jgi:hypothetical protein
MAKAKAQGVAQAYRYRFVGVMFALVCWFFGVKPHG